MNNKIHYYTIINGEMTRITKEDADKITEFNRSLPFDRWNEIKVVYMIKAEN